MNEHALLYRRGERELSPTELAERGKAVRAWALSLAERRILLHPHLFADEAIAVTAEGAVARGPGELLAMSVIQAPDEAAALAVARSFPGLAFGTRVELRLLTAPPAPQ